MFWKFIIIIIASIVAGILVTLTLKYIDYSRKKDRISFKKAFSLAKLPVATFFVEDKNTHQQIPINFLLDSGSTDNIINAKFIEKIDFSDLNSSVDTFGVDGVKSTNNKISFKFYHKNKEYCEEFTAKDTSNVFDYIENVTTVKIDGILGSCFFKKYKYILDYYMFSMY